MGLNAYHRLAGRHGIEPRHPFLDRRLVEFCAWLPLEMRLRGGYPKWAMRQAMSVRLPRDIAWRKTRHLGWPFNKALWEHTVSPYPSPNWQAVLDTVQTRYQQLNNLQDLRGQSTKIMLNP